ncbi:MAG: hypothetical protein M3041_19745 [Acidobacteriota bacterium]|nr:hypothetical protein [Acidobacteriota bacterium]
MKSLFIVVTAFWATAVFSQQLRNDNVVQQRSSAPELLIPAAGSTPGANGTFFKSDITLGNFADHAQAVRMVWLPQGVSATYSTTITLGARAFIRSADFVHDYLGQSGLGAILVTGVNGFGLDPAASLYVASRIWSPQPGTSGTTSQSLPAIPTSTINTTDAALFSLGGVGVGSGFRMNVGFVNLDPVNEQTFNLVFTQSIIPFVIPVTVPPMSMQQGTLGSTNFFNPEILITNGTPAATRSNLWVAYGSTVDNVTGDAWSELAVPGAPNINPPGPIGKDGSKLP